jgi:CRP-like cAMP-binding protein
MAQSSADKASFVAASSVRERPLNRLLAALPDDAFVLLQPNLREITLTQGTICIEAGAPVDQVYFPQNSAISLMVTTQEGELVETTLIGREGAAGIQAGFGERLSFATAMVQIGGKFLVIPAARFEEAANRASAIREPICHYIETLWAEAQQNSICNAIHDGATRLSRGLLQSADRAGVDHVPFTQELLAHMLGVRRTTVTLLAQELQKKGIVRYSRGRIEIVDRNALVASACECYEVSKHENLRARLGFKTDVRTFESMPHPLARA